MIASVVALSVGSGLYLKYVRSPDDNPVPPSSLYSGNDKSVRTGHRVPVSSHPVLQHAQGFQNKQGLKIKTGSWLPQGDQKGVVFIAHGYAEHYGRYLHVIKHLNELGLAVYALDHQGHGRSEGERLYVKCFDDFADDLLQFIKSVEVKPGQKRFLLGHSMGGLISALTATKEPHLFDAVILSSPFIMLDEANESRKPFLMPILKVVSSTFPKMVIDGGLPAEYVSKDPAIVADYLNDPLVVTDVGVKARFIVEASRVQTMLRDQKFAQLKMPILILQAGEDKLVNPKGAQILFELCPSTDKELKMFPGYYHELFNEPEKDDNGNNPSIVIMKDWIRARL